MPPWDFFPNIFAADVWEWNIEKWRPVRKHQPADLATHDKLQGKLTSHAALFTPRPRRKKVTVMCLRVAGAWSSRRGI
jgi:hypothetical protein